MLGVIAEGYFVGMPLVVGASPAAVVELGSTRIVEGSHPPETVVVPTAGMLVTFSVSDGPLLPDEVLDGVVKGGVGVGVDVGVDVVSVGSVLLPVGIVLFPGTLDEVIAGGGVKVVVVLVMGPGLVVDEVRGGSGGGEVPVSVAVEFETGGSPGSLLAVDSGVDTGGSDVGGAVTVDVSLVKMPVPGPVIPSVAVEFGAGSRMPVRIELISPKTELSGSAGSVVLDELAVTIPVGASRISDVLDVRGGCSSEAEGIVGVGVGVSSGVGVGVGVSSGAGVDVSSTTLVLDEDCSGVLVEVSLGELSDGVLLLLLDSVSEEELLLDELSIAELLLVEVSVDEELLDDV